MYCHKVFAQCFTPRHRITTLKVLGIVCGRIFEKSPYTNVTSFMADPFESRTIFLKQHASSTFGAVVKKNVSNFLRKEIYILCKGGAIFQLSFCGFKECWCELCCCCFWKAFKLNLQYRVLVWIKEKMNFQFCSRPATTLSRK